MTEYKKIETAALDFTVLDRISEADVMMWITCRLARVRETGVPASSLECQADFRAYRPLAYYDVSWDMHGLGKCCLHHKTVDGAVLELREQLADNPRDRASRARAEADRLLRQAEEIESTIPR